MSNDPPASAPSPLPHDTSDSIKGLRRILLSDVDVRLLMRALRYVIGPTESDITHSIRLREYLQRCNSPSFPLDPPAPSAPSTSANPPAPTSASPRWLSLPDDLRPDPPTPATYDNPSWKAGWEAAKNDQRPPSW